MTEDRSGKMLYYGRIDVSQGIDVNKTTASKECDICHYCYFLNYSFQFQPNVFNRCPDLLMMSLNLSDIAILNIKGVACNRAFWHNDPDAHLSPFIV